MTDLAMSLHIEQRESEGIVILDFTQKHFEVLDFALRQGDSSAKHKTLEAPPC